jgi:hypothetical protein
MDTSLNLKNLSYVEMVSLHNELEQLMINKAKELRKAVSYSKVTDCISLFQCNGNTYKSYYVGEGTEIWRMNGRKKEELVNKTVWSHQSINDIRLLIGSKLR